VFLPLVVLAALQDVLYGPRVALPLSSDWSVLVRFAIAVPLLILAEKGIDRRLSEAVDQFREEGVVPAGVRPEFESALGRLTRSLNSVIPELILLALAFGSSWVGSSVSYGLTIPNWPHAVPGDASSVTMAGHWLGLVSLPLFSIHHAALVLADLSVVFVPLPRRADEARAHPTHPDGAAGLGFLGIAHTSFSAILVPLALTTGARGVFWVQHGGGTLDALRNVLIAFLVFALALTLGPLLVFLPKLAATKRRGLNEYATLGSEYTHRFDRKWVREPMPKDDLLGSADIQSLADLGNSYAAIRNMKLIPATRGECDRAPRSRRRCAPSRPGDHRSDREDSRRSPPAPRMIGSLPRKAPSTMGGAIVRLRS
jgi:hypothetical protein